MLYYYDYLVFIGRFQPFHKGHQRVVDHALSKSKKLIMLIGSSNVARNARNPWTFEERRDMIEKCYPEEVKDGRLILCRQDDAMYNDTAWVEQAQATVKTIVDSIPGNKPHVTLHGYADMRIGLIGCEKDHTSYYLKLFPKWTSVGVPFLNPINATDIRALFFDTGQADARHLPPEVATYIQNWKSPLFNKEDYDHLRAELLFVNRYREQWADTPHPPVFVTVDAVVVQSGHVLLVRRKEQPGRGQIALPGGFLNNHELIEDGVFRELKEETGIKVPELVLRGSVVDKEVFDNPNRSSRGRTITHAYLIKLMDQTKLPKVKGADDAEKAFWMSFADVADLAREFYEDHWFIIQNMVGRL